jgi:hypothetical protein
MRMIGRQEDKGQRIGSAPKRGLDGGKQPCMKVRSGFQRIVRQRADMENILHARPRQRRSRVSVMPIFSPFSAMASLTIFTVTASTRSSCRNSVSQM